MPGPFDFEVRRKHVVRAFKESPKLMMELGGRVIGHALLRIEKRVIVEGFGGRPRLQSRRGGGGGMVGSFRRKTRKTATQVIGELRNTAPGARIQEFGGVIEPKQSTWLWIPLEPLLTPAGVFRGWDLIPVSSWIRRSKKNPANLVLLGQEGQGPVQAYAVLTKRVEIPPRMGLRAILADEMPRVRQDIAGAVRKALENATRRKS